MDLLILSRLNDFFHNKMKTTFLLLYPKILSVRNAITLRAILKRLPFLLIGIAFWLGFYLGTCKVLDFIRGMPFFGEMLSRKLLSITFFSLGIFLVLSNIITALSTFYISKDIPLLMSKPVEVPEILRLKTAETVAASSWMALSFIPPFFIAYGINYQAPPLFYIMLVTTFIPFIFITGGLGISLAHILTRLFSIKKLRLFLLAGGLVLFIGLYFILKSKWAENPGSPEYFFMSFMNIRTDSPLLPSYWLTEFLMSVMTSQTSEKAYLFFIIAAGLFMLFLSEALGRRLYHVNLERLQPASQLKKENSKSVFYPKTSFAFLWKDTKVFFRDAGQWSQLFIIGALILIYIYNFRTLPVKTLSDAFPFIKEFLALINMLLAGLVLSAVSARFLYSSVSLEGMAFWNVRTSPVPVKKILFSKFLFGFVPVTVIMMVIVLVTGTAINSDPLLTLLSAFTVFILCISISGLGTGMGAMYPKFKHENAAAISMSPGGVFFMLFAFLLVLTTVSAEAYCFYIYRKSVLFEMELTAGQKTEFVIVAAMVLLVNWISFHIPMKMGRKHLEEDLLL